MKRTTVTLLLSAALLVSFFFPIFEWRSFEMSGPNYIMSTHISDHKYLLLIIPVSGIFLFWSSCNDDNNFFNRRVLSWMPVLALALIFMLRWLDKNSDSSAHGNELSRLDIGFWLILFFSVLLVWFREPKKISG